MGRFGQGLNIGLCVCLDMRQCKRRKWRRRRDETGEEREGKAVKAGNWRRKKGGGKKKEETEKTKNRREKRGGESERQKGGEKRRKETPVTEPFDAVAARPRPQSGMQEPIAPLQWLIAPRTKNSERERKGKWEKEKGGKGGKEYRSGQDEERKREEN